MEHAICLEFAARAKPDIARRAGADVIRRCVWSVVLLTALSAAIMLGAVGMHIRLTTISLPAVALLILTAIHFRYAERRDLSRLSDASGVLASLLAALVLAGIVSNAGLRLQRPLVDELLFAADEAAGFDVPAFVRMVAAHPWIATILNWCYVSALPLDVLVGLALAVCGRRRDAWELCLGFCGCLLLASLISTAFPAVAVFAFKGLAGLPGLPPAAGTYFLEAFHAFRDGHGSELDIEKLSGVVTFPSFHVAMALVVPYGLRWHRWLFPLSTTWAAMVIVSTVPIGGHYVVHVIGGIVFWAAIMATSRLLIPLEPAA
jgi:hypothetical protein